MRSTCPDCHVSLEPIQVFADPFASLLYAAGDARPSALGSSDLEGVIHANQCPECNLVLFYAFPRREAGDPKTSAEAFAGAERRRNEARAAALLHKARASVPVTQATVEELLAIFRSSESGEALRVDALKTLAEKAAPEAWLPALELEAPELPANSDLLGLAVRLLCDAKEPVSPGLLAGLASKLRWWDLRIKIIDRLAEWGTDDCQAALLGMLERSLADGLPTMAVAGVQALRRFGSSARLEEILLGVLGHDDVRLVCNAIDTLGEIGTLDVVPAVRDAGRGLFKARIVKQAVEDALELLRERHGAAPGGALTVSDGGRGGLSKAEGTAGLSSSDEADD